MPEGQQDQPAQLPVRGVIAPVFIALGLAAGVLDLRLDKPVFVWLSLGSTAVALAFAKDTIDLIANTFKI